MSRSISLVRPDDTICSGHGRAPMYVQKIFNEKIRRFLRTIYLVFNFFFDYCGLKENVIIMSIKIPKAIGAPMISLSLIPANTGS